MFIYKNKITCCFRDTTFTSSFFKNLLERLHQVHKMIPSVRAVGWRMGIIRWIKESQLYLWFKSKAKCENSFISKFQVGALLFAILFSIVLWCVYVQLFKIEKEEGEIERVLITSVKSIKVHGLQAHYQTRETSYYLMSQHPESDCRAVSLQDKENYLWCFF